MTSAWSGLATGTWYHIAFERVATTCKIFIDGVSQTLTELNAIGTSDVGDLSGNLVIGRNANAGWGQYVNGWIDEFRVSKGIARWTANFTPPTAEYDSNPTTISKVSGVAYSSIKKINGLWMRVLNVEDGMRKTSDAIKLIAAGIMELKLKIDR
jgi:hypothetical protein